VGEVRGISDLPDRREDAESGLLAGAALSGGDLVGVIDVTRLFDALVFDSPDGPRPLDGARP
jgi:hypothetical protein